MARVSATQQVIHLCPDTNGANAAYRWALQPEDITGVFEQLELAE
jgi:hypothetical protein